MNHLHLAHAISRTQLVLRHAIRGIQPARQSAPVNHSGIRALAAQPAAQASEAGPPPDVCHAQLTAFLVAAAWHLLGPTPRTQPSRGAAEGRSGSAFRFAGSGAGAFPQSTPGLGSTRGAQLALVNVRVKYAMAPTGPRRFPRGNSLDESRHIDMKWDTPRYTAHRSN